MIDEEYEDEEALLRDMVRRANANIEKIDAARGKEGAVETVRKMIDGASVVIGIFQDMDEPFGVGVHVIKGQRLMKSVLADGTTRRGSDRVLCTGYKGETGGCVCRPIAIATGKPYQEVYDALQPKLASTRSRRALVETSLKVWRATATEIGRDSVARPCIARATGRNAGRSWPEPAQRIPRSGAAQPAAAAERADCEEVSRCPKERRPT